VQTAILTLHVIVCVILVMLVLLQSGREGMGVIFGGGGNSSVFGSAGAGGILAKLTTFLAVIFICTSLGYNIMTSSSNKQVESVLDVQFEEVPAAPAQAPAGASK
jgi:preprotein translocase subunit SecG